jgi:hypothetical protein
MARSYLDFNCVYTIMMFNDILVKEYSRRRTTKRKVLLSTLKISPSIFLYIIIETRLMTRPCEGAGWRKDILDDALNTATEKKDASLSTRIREIQ